VTEAKWVAGASLFSGRPDPVWTVDAAIASRILARWPELSPTHDPAPVPPALGYRGSFLRNPEGHEWRAFGGIVETDHGGARDARRDDARTFEKAVLATAPEGRLPENLMLFEWR
jgi:hypothetical protein